MITDEESRKKALEEVQESLELVKIWISEFTEGSPKDEFSIIMIADFLHNFHHAFYELLADKIKIGIGHFNAEDVSKVGVIELRRLANKIEKYMNDDSSADSDARERSLQ